MDTKNMIKPTVGEKIEYFFKGDEHNERQTP